MNATKKSTWILVAGRARARLFELAQHDDESELIEIKDFVNPEGRGSEREQVTERRASTHESVGATRHAIEPHTSLRDKSANRFAQELGESLEHGRIAHRYDRIVLVALPHFLGTLHAKLNRQVCESIVAEIPHDLTTKEPAEIRSYLPKRLYS
jgi:protein required for attachment to host cells